MRLYCKAILLAAAISVTGCDDPIPAPTPQSQSMEVLRGHVGRDFTAAPDERPQPLWDALRQLDPDRGPDGTIFGLALRNVWRFDPTEGQPRYLVVEAARYTPIPFGTRIRLTLFDDNGAVRAKSEFTTGMRHGLGSVSLERVTGDYPTIVMECGEVGFQQTSRDYYSRIDGRFDVIRVETREGAAGRNWYCSQSCRHGPNPPSQSPESWEADLCSKDRARVLRALVWLGGRHALAATKGEKVDPQYENEEDAALVRRVRARPRTVALLRELASGDDEWVRQAARLAQRPEDVKR